MAWRILLVLETSGGGSGRHVLDLARGLAAEGHRVHVLYSARRAEPGFVRDVHGLDGVRSAVVDMRRGPHPSDLGAARRVRAYLKAHGPFDIIHGHSSKGGAVARIAALGLGVARVYTPHCLRTMEPTLSPPVKFVYAAIECVLAGITDAVIAVSQEEYDHARRIGISRRRLHVVVNGADPPDGEGRAVLRERIGLGRADVAVGFIGRLVPQKAPSRLLDAFASLAPEHRRARLVMVGDGPLKERLVPQAKALDIAERIIWLPGEAGPATMAAFDIFAMPSLYEGMPYVLLEAAAAGLPIVTTEVGGARTVVTSGRNGYVVPNWDADQFAARLGDLVADRRLRQDMGRASKEAGRGFTVKKMVARTIAVYRSVVEKP